MASISDSGTHSDGSLADVSSGEDETPHSWLLTLPKTAAQGTNEPCIHFVDYTLNNEQHRMLGLLRTQFDRVCHIKQYTQYECAEQDAVIDAMFGAINIYPAVFMSHKTGVYRIDGDVEKIVYKIGHFIDIS
jgi:hypothetical protein